MTPGTYLRLRREAAAVSIDDVESLCDFGSGQLAQVEADTLFASARQLADMQLLFPFSPAILRGLCKGLPMQVCRGCACSTYDPCVEGKRTCGWAAPDLCTTCESKGEAR